MTRSLDELKQQVLLEDYLAGEGYQFGKESGSGNKRCRPILGPCPKCGHKDHLFIYTNTNSFYSHSGCCKNGGSIIDWFMEVEGMSMNDAIDKLHTLAGEERPQRKGEDKPFFVMDAKKTPSQQPDAQQSDLSPTDFTNYIMKIHEETTSKYSTEMGQFLLERGLTVNELIKYKIGVGCQSPTNKRLAVILPVFYKGKAVYYDSRMLEGKYKYMKSGNNTLFNMDYMDEIPTEPIFLTEGIIDAITLEMMGYKAMSLNSVTNKQQFMQLFEEREHLKAEHFIMALDSDEEGINTTNFFKEFGFESIQIPKPFKDINEWFVHDLKNSQEATQDDFSDLGIKLSIDAQKASMSQPDNLERYLELSLDADIDALRGYANKKTGFTNLDKKMNGLNAGLYVVGGVSSVGKTTFVHQLADQLAEQGDHVLYFSLEQSRLEMVTKSLARETAKVDYKKAMTSLEIRKGVKNTALSEGIKNFKKYARNINIIEGNFNTNVLTIREYIERYTKQNNVSPIVFIDYLQIMPATDIRMSDKQRVDQNVTELKRLSRDLSISVFVISSFNRSSYSLPASFESFKESGGIEYTADVVWGLQLGVITSQKFKKLEKQSEKIEMVDEAKAEEIRDIELVCLKNRYGGLFETKFSYHMKHDYYQPNEGLGGFRVKETGQEKEFEFNFDNLKK